jgi:hypothetical protein
MQEAVFVTKKAFLFQRSRKFITTFVRVGVNCSKFDCLTKSRIGRFLSAVRVSIFNLT